MNNQKETKSVGFYFREPCKLFSEVISLRKLETKQKKINYRMRVASPRHSALKSRSLMRELNKTKIAQWNVNFSCFFR